MDKKKRATNKCKSLKNQLVIEGEEQEGEEVEEKEQEP